MAAYRDALEKLVLMIAPMMPHLAEACWAALGGGTWRPSSAGRRFDAALTVDNEIVYPSRSTARSAPI
jgi:leucyl-tRNA synthetase